MSEKPFIESTPEYLEGKGDYQLDPKLDCRYPISTDGSNETTTQSGKKYSKRSAWWAGWLDARAEANEILRSKK